MKNIQLYLLLLVFISCDAAALSWIYKDYTSLEKKHVIAISSDNKLIVDYHRKFTWYSCDDRSYICLMSGIISFSVPKNPGENKKWTINKVDYSLEGKEEIEILGQKIPDVFMIKASFQNDENYEQLFLYSYERGLITICESENKKVCLVLEGKCGFGALNACK
jgi:hypothetical protein